MHYTSTSDMMAYIQQRTSCGELLAQLAEEAAELSQAALKLRRTVEPGASPTPVSREEARRRLNEEVGDVLTCLQLVGVVGELWGLPTAVQADMESKLYRWHNRLKA